MESSSVTTKELSQRLDEIQGRIEHACREAGRSRAEVALMAVSKLHPASAMAEAAQAGLRLFGENRVQEFQGKQEELGVVRQQLEVHLIGHLQSNKAARAVQIFDAIDSVDSHKLALRLNEAAAALNKILPILLELKLSHEEAKSGLAPEGEELAQLLEQLPALANLKLRGVMTVPPWSENAEDARPYFRRLRQLRDQLSARHPRLGWDVLSMGMSGDFAVAIAEGSTEIRIGTALFGRRQVADPAQ